MQWLIITERMKVKVNSKTVANYERRKCDTCDFEKVNLRPDKVKTINNNSMTEQNLKKDHLLTRYMVYADHYISQAPGMFYHTKGQSDPSVMCVSEPFSGTSNMRKSLGGGVPSLSQGFLKS